MSKSDFASLSVKYQEKYHATLARSSLFGRYAVCYPFQYSSDVLYISSNFGIFHTSAKILHPNECYVTPPMTLPHNACLGRGLIRPDVSRARRRTTAAIKF